MRESDWLDLGQFSTSDPISCGQIGPPAQSEDSGKDLEELRSMLGSISKLNFSRFW